ncbi:MAG: threonine synthase [Acidobacteria bacterium]|nr:threonine synthase [Acidobacteriota bacterium]
MRFVTTSGQAPPASLTWALFDGLAPDGSLYVPERIEEWPPEDIAALPSLSLADIGRRVLRPYLAGDIDEPTLASIATGALNFPIPLVEIEPGVHALELFHGPTLAFKDVAARVMARIMSALHDGGDPTTILVATSGDTGGAVGHAFHDVPHMRVVILYPQGRISPTQEAQLTMFNGDEGSNVRAHALAGSFDDAQGLVKAVFADAALLRRVRLSSANSINIGRLLPQMIYYFHAVAQLMRLWRQDASGGTSRPDAFARPSIFCTPSGNFGNLTAGLMAKRAGLPISSFVAATNANDVVPIYLRTGRFEPRPSIQTIANAMDVGNPSNFDRMLWLYGGRHAAMSRDLAGSSHDDAEVRATIRRVWETRGYLLDPHSAIGYLGVRQQRADAARVFLATAHPAKFGEIVEPIIGRAIPTPPALAEALARPPHVLTMERSLSALKGVLGG